MPRKDFLQLLQAVEAARACEGRDCMIVTDAEVADAERIDSAEATHKAEKGQAVCNETACPECVQLGRENAMLRERLRLQGVEIPIGAL